VFDLEMGGELLWKLDSGRRACEGKVLTQLGASLKVWSVGERSLDARAEL
jgi:hypothetical protein